LLAFLLVLSFILALQAFRDYLRREGLPYPPGSATFTYHRKSARYSSKILLARCKCDSYDVSVPLYVHMLCYISAPLPYVLLYFT